MGTLIRFWAMLTAAIPFLLTVVALTGATMNW